MSLEPIKVSVGRAPVVVRNPAQGPMRITLPSQGPRGPAGERGLPGPPGPAGMQGPQGIKGEQGFKGWAPVLSPTADGARSVLKLVDWIGGEGSKPATTSGGQALYASPAGYVTAIANATDVRGAQGVQGVQGNAGWAPLLTIENDGNRRVMRVLDWVGGTGSKPALAQPAYVAADGTTTTIANAADIRGPQGVQGIQGIQGIQGYAGWAPVLAVVEDGERRVYRLADWTGGAGSKPATTSFGAPLYIGPSGFTTGISMAVDIRGPQGLQGIQGEIGPQGNAGWAPVFGVYSDSTRRVLQIMDYVGGTGAKPAVPANTYLGPNGLTPTLANAIDIRGPQGAQGIQGVQGVQGQKGWAPVLAVVSDSARRVLQVIDWQGGEGVKPSTGLYVASNGLTGTIALAMDIRGPTGASGGINSVAGLQGDPTAAQIREALGGYMLKQIVRIPSSGIYMPSAGTRAIWVRAVAGGAGGGGGQIGNTSGADWLCLASGGSAGAYGEALITNVAASYSVVIGAGGSAGSGAATIGNAGGDTIFGDVLTLKGGSGGGSGNVSAALYVIPAVECPNGSAILSSASVNGFVRRGEPGGGGVRLSGIMGIGGNGGNSPFGVGGIGGRVGAAATIGNATVASGYGAGGAGSARSYNGGGTVNLVGTSGTAGYAEVWELH